ncbi:AraC family transcriptional regulator [Gammaproteobacteria bacterium LSUCC0112]|nr:AraC family transcriptional regulator [Gammaproteobacteria bacterium LSUCC0112]
MTQQVVQYFVSALAISQLLFIGTCYLAHYEQQALSRLVAIFSICLTSYIILVMPVTQNAPLAFQQIFRLLAICAPFLLWTISLRLFTDQIETPAWAWLVLLTYTTLRLIGSAADGMGRELDDMTFAMFNYLPQTIMLAFSAHAIFLAIQHFSYDLAEPRRNLRVAFVLTIGLLVCMIVASGFLPSRPEIVRIIFITLIFLHALFFNVFIFRLHKKSAQLTKAGEPVSQPNIKTFYSRADKTFYLHLNATLEKDLLYSVQGLTIKTLADAMQVREYMLRRFINQTLGYRNFNQFLNEFRVKKAIEMLKDSGESSAKISSIALDVGYASLSSFNKAFKEMQGITPSVYRNRLVSS